MEQRHAQHTTDIADFYELNVFARQWRQGIRQTQGHIQGSIVDKTAGECGVHRDLGAVVVAVYSKKLQMLHKRFRNFRRHLLRKNLIFQLLIFQILFVKINR